MLACGRCVFAEVETALPAVVELTHSRTRQHQHHSLTY